MSNRDVIGRGLELLAVGLGPFVDTQMTAAVPGGQDWINVLDLRDRSRHGTAHRNSLSDARFLLRVLTERWRVFSGQLSRADQGYAFSGGIYGAARVLCRLGFEVRNVRNPERHHEPLPGRQRRYLCGSGRFVRRFNEYQDQDQSTGTSGRLKLIGYGGRCSRPC